MKPFGVESSLKDQIEEEEEDSGFRSSSLSSTSSYSSQSEPRISEVLYESREFSCTNKCDIKSFLDLKSTKYRDLGVFSRIEEVINLVLDNRTEICNAFEILDELAQFLSQDAIKDMSRILSSGCDPELLSERVKELEYQISYQ